MSFRGEESSSSKTNFLEMNFTNMIHYTSQPDTLKVKGWEYNGDFLGTHAEETYSRI